MARENQAGAELYLDCASCKSRVSREGRQLWNCGFEARLPGNRGCYPLPLGAAPPESDTCPGYLIELPQVRETAIAYFWMEKGLLREHCGGEPPRALLDHLFVLSSGVADATAAAEAEARRRTRA